MTSPKSDGTAAAPFGRFLTCIALLWLSGVGLRLTILAVPPVIPLIHDDLHMSQTAVGIIAGLPPVLFACAAVPGALLIARLGALRTLIIGLVATGIGSALRGAAPDVLMLYATTILTGFGVAIMQPSLPPLVRAWLPHRIAFGTAVYTNGLLVGEILPVALTQRVVLPSVDGSWRLSFVVWGAVCILIALIVLALAPRTDRAAATSPGAPRRWWPDWRDGLIWRLGVMLGTCNALYFTANGFIPDYLHQTGRPELIGPALTALNVGQLPASALLLVYGGRWGRRIWPYFVCGVISLVACLGILFGQGYVIVASAGFLGFATAAILIFMLALPPLLTPADDIHRMTAGMFTISYSMAVIVPVLSGLIWDMTGIATTAFIPIGVCAVLLMALAPTIQPRPKSA